MKKFLDALFYSKPSAVIFTSLSALAALVFYAFRNSFVFTDMQLFPNFSLTLFVLMVVNTAVLFLLDALRLQKPERMQKTGMRVLYAICDIYAVVSTAIALGFLLGNSGETNTVTYRWILEMLPYWAAAVGFAVALFILPNLKGKRLRSGLCALLAAVLLVSIYGAIFPITPYKFTSGPIVLDNGESYSVVFSTNDTGTGYIEYTYNGETVTRFDANNGRKNGDSIIHTVEVPYAHLQNNTYKVGSTRVIDEWSYGGRNGKTIESEEIAFSGTFSDTVCVLTLSDWHTHTDLAKAAAANLGGYDALILLGDSAPGLTFPEEVVDYTLQFGSALTGGAMPILYTRGNHETRGREADALAGYLGIDRFYFTASLGDYNFIILDSGEDKPDDHPEYGGMTDYAQSRRDMVTWLETLDNPMHNKTIALSHSDEICIEEDLAAAAHEKLEALGVSLLVSGHTHTSEFKAEHSYPTLIDGGINANGDGSYVASMLTLTPAGIELLSVDDRGQTVVQETVAWK